MSIIVDMRTTTKTKAAREELARTTAAIAAARARGDHAVANWTETHILPGLHRAVYAAILSAAAK